ncbi:hypothetical protein ACEVJL_16395 [Pseudoflavonifractor sp. P01025]|uniref:hypothetical protein n=1 Tax=Flintibacter porci TaxID=3342383 RepID=UPI0035B61327
MRKIFSKILCSALVVTAIVSLSSIPALASDVQTTEKGFIPSANSTWGDLYRYFDPDGFAALSPEEKQIFNSILLDDDTTSTGFILPAENADIASTGFTFPIENDDTTSTGFILPIENADTQDRSIDLGITAFKLTVDPTTDSIDYTSSLLSTIPCPKLGIAVTLYNEDGIYVDFNSESEDDAIFCSIDDTFNGLKSKTTYTVHALALITPPPNYVATPQFKTKECTTK